MESIGGAFAGYIANIPSMVVKAETNASLDTFKRYELALVEDYTPMLELASADEAVRQLIESIITDIRYNIDRLTAADPLS
jgi:hypothetical protein